MSSRNSTINISNLEGLTNSTPSLTKAAISSKAITDNISENTNSIPKVSTASGSPSSSSILDQADNYTFSLGSWFWFLFRIFLIVLILAFLGFNIFAYLGFITGKTAEFFKPLLEYLGYPIIDTTKQTLKKSIEGTKKIVDVAEIGIDTGLDTLDKSLDGKIDIMKSLNDAKRKIDSKRENIREQETENIPEPDESGSSTQLTRTGKSGFCYIGEDRGIRSCVRVGINDKCMSGDIFPTNSICVNPNLR